MVDTNLSSAAFCAALGRRRSVVYAPRWWGPVMWLVRRLPAGLLARARI